MKKHFIFGCISIILIAACTKYKETPSLSIYDKALEYIFIQNYYGCFIEKTTETSMMDSLFWADESKREEIENYFLSERDESIAMANIWSRANLD